jgi:DNA topoisomerase-1
MSKTLVIVESPAKAKTISKILGKGYIVKASAGHVRDLPQKEIGVDVNHNFAPKYVIIPKKEDIVKELHLAAEGATAVYLAPDPDREGEAIAWHLAQLLVEVPRENLKRIEFHEITQDAVRRAVANPRPIDINRVDAQQARRVLDRLVGYKISPLLWKKIQRGLSAGRVQSVALRLVCDRVKEIEAFVSKEYWTLKALLHKQDQKKTFSTELVKWANKKPVLDTQADIEAVLRALTPATFTVQSVKHKERKKEPSAPFITSTLQREAASALNFAVKRTMKIAQELYEGIELGAEGPVGLITYMRTDSTRVAQEAQEAVNGFIEAQYGKKYLPATQRKGKAAKGGQDAHEAIRPTEVSRLPDDLKAHLTAEQYKLYRLIWQRFVGSQMAAQVLTTRTVEIEAQGTQSGLFRAADTQVVFDGYTKVYQEAKDEQNPEEATQSLPDLIQGELLTFKEFAPKQHFTQPPPAYSEATLVKTLEELGIGRPSTYAPTISTIVDRGYVVKNGRALTATPLGLTVNEQMMHYFPDIVDTEFTATMESQLDAIERGERPWTTTLDEFYTPFLKTLEAATEEMERVLIVTDYLCEKCGSPMVQKSSKYGNFLGCSSYPTCKHTHPLTKENLPAPKERPAIGESCTECGHEPMMIVFGPYGEYLKCFQCAAKRRLLKKTGVTCPKCNVGAIVERKSRFGRFFYGCSTYPTCDFSLWQKPLPKPCPQCGGIVVLKPRKRTEDIAACTQCDFITEAEEFLGEPSPVLSTS